MRVWNRGLYYGWPLLFISALNLFLIYGTRFVFSVAYPVILEETGWSRASTALIFSFNLLFYGLTTTVAGSLFDRLGPRKVMAVGLVLLALGLAWGSRVTQIWQLYLFLGALAAIGIGTSGYLPHSLIINHWFVRRRGTALGLLMVGSVTSFVMGIPFQYLASHFGWRGAYLVMAGGPLVVLILLGLFIRNRPQDMGLQPDGIAPGGGIESSKRELKVVDEQWAAVEWTLPRAMRTSRFWALVGCNFSLFGLGTTLVITHEVAFFQDVGYSKMLTALIFGLYGVFRGAGSFLGFLSDLLGREKAFTLGCLGGIVGVGLLLLIRDTSTPWLLYLYVVVFGLGMGLVVAPFWAGVVDIFGMKHYGAIGGVILAGFAVGGAFSAWLGGLIFDRSGSYTLGFYLALFALLAALVLFWLAAPRKVIAVARKDRGELVAAGMGYKAEPGRTKGSP